jgi:hypothetical protein
MEAADRKESVSSGCLTIIGILLAICVVAGQSCRWLQTGVWPNLTLHTVATPMISGSEFSQWLEKPQLWLGLHRLVAALFRIPLWIWITIPTSGIDLLRG